MSVIPYVYYVQLSIVMWFHRHKSPNRAVATTDNNLCSVLCAEIVLWLIAIIGEVLISAVTTISF